MDDWKEEEFNTEKQAEEMTSPKKKKSKKGDDEEVNIGKELVSLLLYLAVVVAVCFLVIRFVGIRSVVEGSSMNDTLNDGDSVIVEKVTYYFHDPERFDVVVFELADQPNIHYIKRIIGLPGETVQIIDGYVYITEVGSSESKRLDSDIYGKEVMENGYAANSPITLGEDEYFVLGDNRNNSSDSRMVTVGPVQRRQILGRAWARIWPLWEMKFITHQ